MTKLYRFSILILFPLTAALGSCSQTSTKTNLEIEIDHYLERHVDNGKFNGTLLIARGDSLVYHKSFGMANREFRIDHSDSTKYLIGSITKPFTAFSILLLEEQGKLSLSDKLSKYFPNFQSADSISLSQLLNHTSGIADYKMLNDWRTDSKLDDTTPLQTIEKMSKLPLLFQPGERFRYSNVGYILLGLIVEDVSQQSFAGFIQKQILVPLELKNTGVIDNKSVIPNLASGYSSTPKETLKAPYVNYEQPFTSGNMYSTNKDLWTFTKAIMDSKLLPIEKTEQVFQGGEHYGYGWGLRNFGDLKAFGHYGAMNGFVGALTFIPSTEYFICLLTNDDNTPKVRITTDLVSILQEQDVPLPEKTKLIELSNSVKSQIIGCYLVKPGDTIRVFEEHNTLYLQESGQDRHQIFPFSEYGFSFKLLEFNCFFQKLKQGKALQMQLKGREIIFTAERISDAEDANLLLNN